VTEPPPMSATLQMWEKYLTALKSSPKNLLLRKEVIERAGYLMEIKRLRGDK
jgi:hypothetical protein